MVNYRDRLSPWCIIQHLPKMQRCVVARFRKRNHAEDHLRALQRLNPAIRYEIVFDPPDAALTSEFRESDHCFASQTPKSKLQTGIDEEFHA